MVDKKKVERCSMIMYVENDKAVISRGTGTAERAQRFLRRGSCLKKLYIAEEDFQVPR